MNKGLDGVTLVTGATGFLGPHVVAAAVVSARREATFAEPEGQPVFGAGRSIELAPSFCTPRDAAELLGIDLLEADALERLFDECQPRTLIHCAALARIEDCEAEPELAQATNSLLPERLARLCAERSLRMLHVSTDLVFGAEPAPRGGFREEQPVGPLSVYGRTKAEGEARVLAALPAALVVRLPLLYGDSGGRGLGASDSLLMQIDKDELPRLFTDEYRTPLEVRDAAAALVELAASDARGMLHLAGPDRVSRHELGLAVLRAMGIEAERAPELVERASRLDASRPETRPGELCLDARRALALLECRLHGLERGLERALS